MPEMQNYLLDPACVRSDAYLWGDYEATCSDTDCAWMKRFPFLNGMKLELGDLLPRGEDPNFDTCMRCKKKSLRISRIPVPPPPDQPVGFWKIPTE